MRIEDLKHGKLGAPVQNLPKDPALYHNVVVSLPCNGTQCLPIPGTQAIFKVAKFREIKLAGEIGRRALTAR